MAHKNVKMSDVTDNVMLCLHFHKKERSKERFMTFGTLRVVALSQEVCEQIQQPLKGIFKEELRVHMATCFGLTESSASLH